MIRHLFVGVSVLAVSACGGGGPSTNVIVSGSQATVTSQDTPSPYVVVDVDQKLAVTISSASTAEMSFFADAGAVPVILGSGDTVQVSIVSSSETGFVDFTSASLSPISSTALPPQTIGVEGTINMPPVGRLRATGLSIEELETQLEQRLGEVLVEPSVIVELIDRRSSRVNVVGEVGSPQSVPITEVNARVLDVILASGGPEGRSEDLVLSLSRSGKTERVPLQQLYENSRYNVSVRSGDVVALERTDRRFTVLGATGNQTLRFDEPSVSLAQALAEAGGLESPRSDRTGVFLYRKMSRDILASIGTDLSGVNGEVVNTVFRFDFSEPGVLFTAGEFEVMDDDVLYVADSANANISNVLSVLTNFVPAPVEFSRDAAFE